MLIPTLFPIIISVLIKPCESIFPPRYTKAQNLNLRSKHSIIESTRINSIPAEKNMYAILKEIDNVQPDKIVQEHTIQINSLPRYWILNTVQNDNNNNIYFKNKINLNEHKRDVHKPMHTMLTDYTRGKDLSKVSWMESFVLSTQKKEMIHQKTLRKRWSMSQEDTRKLKKKHQEEMFLGKIVPVTTATAVRVREEEVYHVYNWIYGVTQNDQSVSDQATKQLQESPISSIRQEQANLDNVTPDIKHSKQSNLLKMRSVSLYKPIDDSILIRMLTEAIVSQAVNSEFSIKDNMSYENSVYTIRFQESKSNIRTQRRVVGRKEPQFQPRAYVPGVSYGTTTSPNISSPKQAKANRREFDWTMYEYKPNVKIHRSKGPGDQIYQKGLTKENINTEESILKSAGQKRSDLVTSAYQPIYFNVDVNDQQIGDSDQLDPSLIENIPPGEMKDVPQESITESISNPADSSDPLDIEDFDVEKIIRNQNDNCTECGLDFLWPYIVMCLLALALLLLVYFLYWKRRRRYMASIPNDLIKAGHIGHIYAYPVAFAGGILLCAAEVFPVGLRWDWLRDRYVYVFDSCNHSVTPDQCPEVGEIQTKMHGSILIMCHEDMEDLSVDLKTIIENKKVETGFINFIPVPAHDCGWSANEWINRLLAQHGNDFKMMVITSSLPARLNRQTNILQGSAPVTLANDASVPPQYRCCNQPNLVVKGAPPNDENRWGFVKIGGTLFEVVEKQTGPCGPHEILLKLRSKPGAWIRTGDNVFVGYKKGDKYPPCEYCKGKPIVQTVPQKWSQLRTCLSSSKDWRVSFPERLEYTRTNPATDQSTLKSDSYSLEEPYTNFARKPGTSCKTDGTSLNNLYTPPDKTSSFGEAIIIYNLISGLGELIKKRYQDQNNWKTPSKTCTERATESRHSVSIETINVSSNGESSTSGKSNVCSTDNQRSDRKKWKD